MSTRTERRQHYDAATRLQLLEEDADAHDKSVAAMNSRLGKILAVCTSLLVSTCTAILLLALNLVVNR